MTVIWHFTRISRIAMFSYTINIEKDLPDGRLYRLKKACLLPRSAGRKH